MTGASSQHEELYSRVTALGSLRTIALEDEDSPFPLEAQGYRVSVLTAHRGWARPSKQGLQCRVFHS